MLVWLRPHSPDGPHPIDSGGRAATGPVAEPVSVLIDVDEVSAAPALRIAAPDRGANRVGVQLAADDQRRNDRHNRACHAEGVLATLRNEAADLVSDDRVVTAEIAPTGLDRVKAREVRYGLPRQDPTGQEGANPLQGDE